MEPLERQVRRAQVRLNVQRFLIVLSWCWFATLLAAALAIAADKVWTFGLHPGYTIGAALVAGLCGAAFWTWMHRHRHLDAAIELDRRFGLKERVASALSLNEGDRDSEVGRALMSDASKRAEALAVGEQFQVRPNRWALLPLAPALLAVLITVFINPIVGPETAEATTSVTESQKQVKKSSETLRRKLEERRREAEALGLEDAEQLFRDLEDGTRDIEKDKQANKRKALVKLNDLNREVEARRDKLGAGELKKKLNKMTNMGKGPAEKFADALQKGDLGKAVEELNKLSKQIKEGNLTEEEKKALGKQLSKMSEKLKEMVEAQKQREQALEEQIKQQRAAGNKQQAEQLEKQLEQLRNQQQQQNQMQQLADQMAQCAQCMQQGQAQNAADGLTAMADQLSQLQDQLNELEMLDDIMDQIADAKDAMDCKGCDGEGCAMCQGQGNGKGKGDRPGRGLGEGRGQGDRPEEEDETSTYESQVKQKVGRGGAVVTGMVGGPNAKGEVAETVRQQYDDAATDDSDPLTGQRLPRGLRDHAKDYFESLREGE